MTVATTRPGGADEAHALIAIERRAAQRLIGHEAYPLFSTLTLPVDAVVQAAHAARLWVADVDGTPVGFALYGALDGQAHLLEMDVDPAFGRRGIGRALLEAVCDAARSEGFPAIVLTTLADVPWNAPFYARAGFVEWPPEHWGDGMREVIAQERRLGFPMQLRVAMRRALA